MEEPRLRHEFPHRRASRKTDTAQYQVLRPIEDVNIAGYEQLHFPHGFYMKSAAALSSVLVAATRISTLQGSVHSRQFQQQ
jgi:hypothetical protein